MARQLLVVGLGPDATTERAVTLQAQIREFYPELEVLLIAQCTSLTVIDAPEASA